MCRELKEQAGAPGGLPPISEKGSSKALPLKQGDDRLSAHPWVGVEVPSHESRKLLPALECCCWNRTQKWLLPHPLRPTGNDG